MKTPLDRFLKIGWAEGWSFLILLFIAMPIKYLAGNPVPVKVVGMLHGILFVLYVLALLQAASAGKWKLKTTVIALFLSFIPFGTFGLKKLIEGAA